MVRDTVLKRTNVRLPVGVHKQLKEVAIQRGTSVEAVVLGAIRRELRCNVSNGVPSTLTKGLPAESSGGTRWQQLRRLVVIRRELRAVQQRYHDELLPLLGDTGGSVRPLGADVSLITAYLQEIPASAVVKDLRGRIIWCNKDYEDLTGFLLPALKQKTAMDLWPATFARVIVQHDALVAKGKAMQVVELLPTEEGSIRHRLALRFPIRNVVGRIVYTASIGFDLPELPPIIGPLYRVDMLPRKPK